MVAIVAVVFEARARAVGGRVEELHPGLKPRGHAHAQPVLACNAYRAARWRHGATASTIYRVNCRRLEAGRYIGVAGWLIRVAGGSGLQVWCGEGAWRWRPLFGRRGSDAQAHPTLARAKLRTHQPIRAPGWGQCWGLGYRARAGARARARAWAKARARARVKAWGLELS